MHINVIETAQLLAGFSVTGKTVVVLDVFRSASTIITALINGSEVIFPVSSVDEAYEQKSSHPQAILGGERFGDKIQGFDLGNSPFEYGEEIVRDKPVIFLSTNGTKAILAACGAEKIYVASFLNGLAAAQKLRTSSDLLLACAGTKGAYSLEDTCCAGYLIHLLYKMSKLTLSDSAAAALVLYQAYQDNLSLYLSKSTNGSTLASKGRQSEIQYCCTRDILALVPEFIQEKGILPFPFEERRNCSQ